MCVCVLSVRVRVCLSARWNRRVGISSRCREQQRDSRWKSLAGLYESLNLRRFYWNTYVTTTTQVSSSEIPPKSDANRQLKPNAPEPLQILLGRLNFSRVHATWIVNSVKAVCAKHARPLYSRDRLNDPILYCPPWQGRRKNGREALFSLLDKKN